MKKLVLSLSTFALIAASIFVFASCEKEENTDVQPQLAAKNMEYLTNEGVPISFTDIENLALKHNQYLDEILENYNLDNEDYQSEIIYNIMNANLDGATTTQKQQICNRLMGKSITPSEAEMEETILQSDALDNKTDILHFIHLLLSNTSACTTFEDFSNTITSIQNAACGILKNNDIIFYLSYSELYRKSIYYWLPEELGGNGYGYSILCYATSPKPNQHNNNVRKGVKIAGDAVIADCSALAISMSTIGLLSIVFPPAGAGALITTAVEAAVGSAASAASTALRNKR